MAERRGKACADPSGDPHETLAELVGRFYAEGSGATALFVPADSVCAAAYPMLRRPGRRPGDGLDVVSCDHERVRLESLRPEPVTIDPGVEQIGRIAVRQLRSRSSAPGEPSARLQVAPRLVLPMAAR
jgi:DNA-binding LacI/PurR family transcriptional regulator